MPCKKSESAFTRYVDVCDDCVKTARKTSLWENINTSYASIAIVAVIVLVSAFLIFGPSFGESDVEKERKERVLPGREVRNGINDGTFEEARFNRLLTDGKYYEAYDYAVSFGMKDVLAGVVEEAVFRKFREIIVETRPYTLISEKCLTFITANRRILQELNFDVDELNTFARSWQKTLRDYRERQSYLGGTLGGNAYYQYIACRTADVLAQVHRGYPHAAACDC